MTKYKKESLEGLLKLVQEITDSEENLWFKNALEQKYGTEPSLNNFSIERIYEFCIKEVTEKQGIKFYEDFKIETIKRSLIEDYIRMEHFRREDNFEDFCLAMFQQLEGIVNNLMTDILHKYILANKDVITFKDNDKSTRAYVEKPLWKLIFFPSLSPIDLEHKINKPILEWDFSERYKAFLFYYYFNKKIYTYQNFKNIFFLGNELYQSRNLNHRGGITSESQKKVIKKVTDNSHSYYFKFLGFLEDVTSTINKNL